jgi:hypothetical protein
MVGKESGLWALLALALALPIAAGGQPAPPALGGGLFISPAGQPFRARPGEPYPVAAWFAQVDTNHDGKIDRAEFRADFEAFFKVLDENHDGVIDGFELADYEQKVAPEILGAYFVRDPAAPPDSDDRARDRRDPQRLNVANASAASVFSGAAPYSLEPTPEPVAAADLASDNHITLAEFLRVADRRFDRLDVKHLGYLTLDTLPKTLAQGGNKKKR